MDPRETPTARTADIWLPLKPCTDVAILNAMLRHVIAEGLPDKEYIASRTRDWEKVRTAVEPYTFEVAERIVGVPAKRIRAVAEVFGDVSRSIVMHARGIKHSTHGMTDYAGVTWERSTGKASYSGPANPKRTGLTTFVRRPIRATRTAWRDFTPSSTRRPPRKPNEAFPMRLTTGRVVYHYLSGNQTRRLGFPNSQAPEPWVEIHPWAAARFGAAHGDRVRMCTPRG